MSDLLPKIQCDVLSKVSTRLHQHSLDETSDIILTFDALLKTINLLVKQVICCLEGARIGIQFETSFAGNISIIFYVQ